MAQARRDKCEGSLMWQCDGNPLGWCLETAVAFEGLGPPEWFCHPYATAFRPVSVLADSPCLDPLTTPPLVLHSRRQRLRGRGRLDLPPHSGADHLGVRRNRGKDNRAKARRNSYQSAPKVLTRVERSDTMVARALPAAGPRCIPTSELRRSRFESLGLCRLDSEVVHPSCLSIVHLSEMQHESLRRYCL